MKGQLFYISLVGPLRGYYLKVVAFDENTAVRWAKKNLFKLYCGVYSLSDLANFFANGYKDIEDKVIGEVIRLVDCGCGVITPSYFK